MKGPWVGKVFLLIGVVVIFSTAIVRAQSIVGPVQALPPDENTPHWVINVAFAPAPTRRIKEAFVLNTEDLQIIRVTTPNGLGTGLYSMIPRESLQTWRKEDGTLEFGRHYELRMIVENNDPAKDDVFTQSALVLYDPNKTINVLVENKSKAAKDSDIYISGELNGAHKEKTRFSTEIKFEVFRKLKDHPHWLLGKYPFFNLNASTDPDADPDSMEFGWAFRYTRNKFYFDQKPKIESERDFDNTNLIYDARLTLLPSPKPKGKTDAKVFINPFFGTELGKNLRSPLKAAEGDGIARVLAGADVRVAFYLRKNADQPDINWTTSYTRRWLLTDELGFEADKDGKLQLTRFGTSPRDYVSSKVSYGVTKFFEIFTEYEWGQLPPSFKLVDHRFRLGFAYKKKFAVE